LHESENARSHSGGGKRATAQTATASQTRADKEIDMTARARRLRNDEITEDFTVHSSPSRRQVGKRASPEDGLSVDADELGTRFLSGATEQGNYESQHEPDLSLTNGAATDDAMPGGDVDAEGNLWDQTIRQSPRSDVREITDVAIRDDDERGVDPDSPDDGDEEDAREVP
jgi:hypothetical protein